MKKKTFSVIAAIVACLCALFAFAACGSSTESPSDSLEYGKKYIHEDDVNSEKYQRYIIFNKDNTGEYYYYYVYKNENYPEYDYVRHYTVKFKYTYADLDKTAVVCFYDSVEYEKDDTEKEISSNWSSFYTVSPNVLIDSGNSYFINEDYLSNIPNFRG